MLTRRLFLRSRIDPSIGYNFDPPVRDPGSSMVSGVGNSTAAQIVKVICQLGSVLVLSRLLTPADFGLIAMAGPVYGFLLLFQDLGLGLATVQRPVLTHQDVNFFFWVNVAVGVVLSVILIALSPAIGSYYHEPRLMPVVMAMVLPIMAASLGTQSGAILMRRMEFRVLAINGALGAVAGLAVALGAALLIKNYWALYLGTLTGTAVPALGAIISAGWLPSRPRNVPHAREMLSFGGGVTLSNAAHFVARNADNVLIGWRWGEGPLGLYDRAYKLLLFPLQFIVGPTMYAMAPILSRLDDDPARYRSLFLNAVSQLLLAVWPGIIWAMVFSHDLVPKLLGAQWAPASGIFQALAVAGLLQVINGAPIPLFVSQARTAELARWGVFYAVTCVIAFVLGLRFGVIAVAYAYAVSECIRTPLLWFYVTRRGPIGLRDVVTALAPHLAAALCCGLALGGLTRLLAWTSLSGSYGALAIGLVTSYAITVLMLLALPGGRQTLAQAWDSAAGLVRRFVARTAA
ncbi:lipopolysaccharide biosynthesis protein [Sphingomonas koreensis]|nr:lipopolysaccharide biosynthesis protein [Sphingomonas koreensis]